MTRFVALLLFGLASASSLAAQPAGKSAGKARPKLRPAVDARSLEGATEHVYRTVAGVPLRLFIFQPPGHQVSDRRAAIVFFFGGGWTSGSPEQFAPHCRYLASRGMLAITAEYRIRSKHPVTVPDCVADAQAAVGWVRSHAGELGVDPDRIASGGGSAGGHLAACAGVLPGPNGGQLDQIRSQSNAMVLFNPVMVLAHADGLPQELTQRLAARREQFGGDPQAISPYHHVQTGQPPAIMFFGSADPLLPSATAFEQRYRQAGNRVELKTWAGPGHGFFNFGRENNRYFVETVRDMDRFLSSLGYLDGEPTIDRMIEQLRAEGR